MQTRFLAVASLMFMAHTGSAQQVPRAVPVGPDGAAPPKAQIVTDEPPPPRAQPVKPTGPDEDLFDYAMLGFTQKDYTIAAQSFGQYLQSYPQGRQVPWALFRLGECFRLGGKAAEAERYYREVVDRYPKSEASPSSAYWMGVMSFNAADFKAAATYFNFCETKTTAPAVKLAAAFYKSEAYGALKDRKKQLEALKPVLALKKDNEFLERALLSSATILQTDGKNKEALPILLELMETAADPKVQGDACLKAAIIQGELKNSEEASKLYERVLANQGASPEQRGAALVGLVGELYAKSSYDVVIETYNRNATLLPPPDLRSRLLMQVGNAHRATKSYARAIDLYDLILRFSPQDPIAFEAAYWRVYCFYMLEDRKLGDTAREFVRTYGPTHPDHEFINKARLLVADHHFNRQEYKQAVDQYEGIQVAKLPANLRPSTLYHKGWSQAETGKHSEAAASLTEFITASPTDPDVAKALAKRGLSYKETKDNAKALADFQRIITEFPKDDSLELAYYLSGLIHGDQNNNAEMVKDFETMLKLFPSSPAAAEASYRAGVGHIILKDTDKALPLLRKAVSIDKKTYGNLGSQKIQLCLWNKKDAEALSKEVDAYRGTYADASIPPSMLGYLGLTFFDRKDFTRSAKYLAWASTPDVPENTDPRIWNYLAQALLEVKNYDDSAKAVEHFLAVTPDSLAKAKGQLTKAKALLGSGKLTESQAAADEGLRIVKDGEVQGQLLIVEGDALIAEGDKLEAEGNHDMANAKWKAAAAKYVVPSQILNNPTITPEALDKAAKALERMADKRGADELREQLRKQYPNYQAA